MEQLHGNSSLNTPYKAFYICPMHPEIRREQPGNCPKCGMALERVADTSSDVDVEYVCPMHPEVIRNAPGSCPKCGMALKPREISGKLENHELIDMSRRLWVSAVLSIPVFMMAMAHDLMLNSLPVS